MERLIRVFGEAEVRVVPDEVIISLGVQTSDRQMLVAKSQNDGASEKLMLVARSHGVVDADIQTDHISIDPHVDSKSYSGTASGFTVRNSVSLTLRDLSKFEPLLMGLLAAGANVVHGISFRTSQLRHHRDEARAMALRAARDKAQALAAVVGLTVGAPHEIIEERSGWVSSHGIWWSGRYAAMSQNVSVAAGETSTDASGIAPGQITITARLSASFILQGESSAP